MAAGEAWFSRAKAAEAAYVAGDGDLAPLLDLVCEYEPEWPCDAIRAEASGRQVYAAFVKLLEMNDPLADARARAQKAQAEQMALLDRAEMLLGKDKIQEMLSSGISSALESDSE